MTRDGVAELSALARRSAREAGALVFHGRPDVLSRETKSSPTDVVTEMDKASEDLLRTLILRARPDDGILGEEGGERKGSSGVRWVIDPIDGTTNYLYGLPVWAVSVGVEVDGQTVAGVVEAPAISRSYWAVLGGGAFEEILHPASLEPITPARRLHCSGQELLAHALVSTGFGYSASRRAEQAEDLRRIAPRVRDIRRLGAASLDLAWVAAGYTDAYYETGLHAWDLCAGSLIATEAGAVVWTDPDPTQGLSLASTPGIYEAMRALVR